ncbi:MAG TPA: aminodeoxychorismate synthase component I [Burkholderiaceae bacterium]|nr:aminodeoxychorismate synthase component I [Burkholderiaceae bacterium]
MVSALIDFVDAGPGGTRLRAAFGAPRETLMARSADEVMPLLDRAHARAREGAWCVGYVRYEAAAAFDGALPTHAPDGPLAWFAVYEAAEPWPALRPASHSPMQWTSALDRGAFDERIVRIHQAIADGEVYQINLTAPLTSRFDGDALGLFDALHRAQPAAYALYLNAGEEQLLSVSPELFFDWRDGRLLGRPMKGTAPRGATPEADRAAAEHLRASEKERAENLMIVDLIRNDMSRVAEPFSVQVPRLFHAQAWPTVWQMTSDVTARTRDGAHLSDVFRALFPCGSITGAPKRRAMHWIRELEPEPRGIYCGATGVLQPGGAASFNVAIRSVVLRDGIARCGIGSGITSDAKAAAEWDEWRHKQGFLQRAARPFELLETLRLQDGEFVHGAAHVERLALAAGHFGFDFNPGAVQAALAPLAARHPQGAWRVRLLLPPDGRARAEAHPLAPTSTPVRVVLAQEPIDADSEFVRFKTTRREHYDAFAPSDASVFDTLLWNARGELTEFTRGNVAVKVEGVWWTPPLQCGLLAGIGRAQALCEGRIAERVIRVDELASAEGLAFINSMRGWLEAQLLP